jgi:hypothetical protein
VRDYGQNDLKEVEQALFQPFHSVSAWFAPEVKLGSLAGSMELPGCFGAEIYAQVRGAAGSCMRCCVGFAAWLRCRQGGDLRAGEVWWRGEDLLVLPGCICCMDACVARCHAAWLPLSPGFHAAWLCMRARQS